MFTVKPETFVYHHDRTFTRGSSGGQSFWRPRADGTPVNPRRRLTRRRLTHATGQRVPPLSRWDTLMTKERLIQSNGFEVAVRVGFVARGVVYGLIGALAVLLATGAGGKAANQQGALETVARQPFGHALVVAIAACLASYALWRLVRASLGRVPEDSNDSLTDRVGDFGNGIVYAFLAAVAAGVAVGHTHGNGALSNTTAGILGWPLGRELVAGAGAVLRRPLPRLARHQPWLPRRREGGKMSDRMRRFVLAIGVVGHVSRMVAFELIGIFLVKAAVEYDPRTAVGIGGALGRLTHQPAGHALLGVVAAGLVAFGLFSMVDARYHRL